MPRCNRRAVLIFCLGAAAQIASAASGKWTSGGPEGGSILALVAGRQDPTLVYAGSYGAGVFKSSDSGTTWSATSLDTGRVRGLVIDPTDSRIVYAATDDLFKSGDGGVSWKAIHNGLPDRSVTALAIDPSLPNVLYVGISNNFAPLVSGLYKSTDGGETWQRTGLANVGIEAVAIDPTNSRILYAAPHILRTGGVDYGLGLYKSNDGGTSWVVEPQIDSGLPFTAIAIDPVQSSTVYAAVLDRVWKTTDAGATWSETIINPGGQLFSTIAVDPFDHTTVFAATDVGIFRTTDAGATWPLLPGSPRSVNALSASSIVPNRVYAGIFSQYAPPTTDVSFRSDDGGETWQGSRIGFVNASVTGLAIDPEDPLHLFASSSLLPFGGVWESRDGGVRWQQVGTNLGPTGLDILVAAGPSTLYARAVKAGVCVGTARSGDGGRTWQSTGLSCGTVIPVRGNANLVYANTPTTFCRSVDAGLTWSCSAAPILSIIAVDPASSAVIYGSAPGSNNGTFKSTDGGATWTHVSSLAATSLLVDLFRSSVLYAIVPANQSDLTDHSRVFKSIDSGATWTESGAGLDALSPLTIVADPAHPDTLFVGTFPQGLFQTVDGGRSWFQFSWGLPGASVGKLAIDGSGRFIHAAVAFKGVYDFERPAPRSTVARPEPRPRKPRVVR